MAIKNWILETPKEAEFDRLFHEHMTRLRQYDTMPDEIDPAKLAEIHRAIERMDAAWLDGDLQGFKAAIQSLYFEEAPTGRVAYRIYSELLQTHLWVCETDKDMHSLRTSQGITEAIYTADEIRKLKGMNRESLKAIHKVKEVFENSEIIETAQVEELYIGAHYGSKRT